MSSQFLKSGARAYSILKLHRHISTQSKLVHSCFKNENQFICRFRNIEFSCVSLDFLKPSVINFSVYRNYAKGKDKKKSDKGGPKAKGKMNEDTLADIIQISSMRNSMQLAVDHMKDEYIKNLSLRSATGSIETLQLTFEGKEYTLEELAQVVRKNPKTIVINMSSFPQAIPAVLTALSKSGMNLNPQQDGTTLFVPVPKITKEHRENLSKNAKTLFVKCRDNIRDIKNKYTKAVKNKEKEGLSQDDSHEICDQLVHIHEEYIDQASKILLAKQQELMGD